MIDRICAPDIFDTRFADGDGDFVTLVPSQPALLSQGLSPRGSTLAQLFPGFPGITIINTINITIIINTISNTIIIINTINTIPMTILMIVTMIKTCSRAIQSRAICDRMSSSKARWL